MKTVIFDLDGTLIDSMDIHYKVVNEILKDLNKQISREDFRKYAGMPFLEIAKKITKKKDLTQLDKKREELIEKNFKNIKLMQGATKILKTLKKNNYKIAIASGSPINFIEKSLKQFKIEKYFDYYVSGEQVKKPKPAPDIFLHTAKKLETEPKNCIVLEDGISSIITANKLGMKTIGIGSNLPATKTITSLKELKLEDF